MSWSSMERLVESDGCVAINLAASSNLSGYCMVASAITSHPLSKPSIFQLARAATVLLPSLPF